MATRTVEIPEEILRLLEGSRLADRPETERVKAALAIHLMQEGVISVGRAAELAGEPRASFEVFLSQLGIPVAHYDASDHDEESRTLIELERRRQRP
jgi:predicted HTH domain antitoxin